jgi:glucose/mannose transport system substrate-binding protein
MMKSNAFLPVGALGALLAGSSTPTIADEAKEIQILRPASIGASQAALDVVKRALAAKGYDWKETAASGEALSAVSNTEMAPTGAMLNGFEILKLARAGKLGDISAVARKGSWTGYLPDPIVRFLFVDGKWIGAPIDITPVNGLWVNAGLMDKIGGLEPKSLDDFFALLDKAKESGVDPLAIGNDPLDQASLFDLVLVATAGADFYKRVFGDINESDIKSATMERAFNNFARLRDYVDNVDAGRDNNAATRSVVNGQALAIAGPSPTKMAFLAAGKTPGKDFRCYRFPGVEDSILYTLDLIAMPNVEPNRRAAQSALAETTMDAQVQMDASRAKGAVPARGGLEPKDADVCETMDDDSVKQALATGHFYGSMAQGYMQPPSIAKAYIDVVAKFYRGEIKSPTEATIQLYAALSAPR